MNSIRIVRVLPTVRDWSTARLVDAVAARAATARTKVPRASRPIPIMGLTLVASFVEPRLAASPRELKTSLRVRPASKPPAVWKRRYGTTRSRLRSRADAAANVSAGLITAPECSPRRKMITETLTPKVRATRYSASGVEDSESVERRIIEDGPATTRAKVPISSETHLVP